MTLFVVVVQLFLFVIRDAAVNVPASAHAAAAAGGPVPASPADELHVVTSSAVWNVGNTVVSPLQFIPDIWPHLQTESDNMIITPAVLLYTANHGVGLSAGDTQDLRGLFVAFLYQYVFMIKSTIAICVMTNCIV